MTISLAVFASGTGTNTENLIRCFRDHPRLRVGCVVSDREGAPVLATARSAGIPARAFSKAEWEQAGPVLDYLKSHRTGFIALAGFLRLVPHVIITAYPGRIVNIHPALLPRFGGKGMYGRHVHEAVIRSGSRESGITIHQVNDRYDEGDILFQAKTKLDEMETPETLKAKIRKLELENYPRVIERLATAT